jgi:hypothetical protein
MVMTWSDEIVLQVLLDSFLPRYNIDQGTDDYDYSISRDHNSTSILTFSVHVIEQSYLNFVEIYISTLCRKNEKIKASS